jgi:CRISPR-associated protein Cas5d
MPPEVTVKVWSEYACFTRPELKVERLSYPIMTPSAARGVLDAILWKPQMTWHVRRITVLAPRGRPPDASRPPYELVGIRRNEIQGKIAPSTVEGWMTGKSDFKPYYVDSAGREGVGGQNRTQRNTLALRDVCYLIHATPLLTARANQPREKPPVDDESDGPDTVAKYVAMFQRRVEKGQCFHRPYLGCREFACDFAPAEGSERPVAWGADPEVERLGLMLYDIRFQPSGRQIPGFFQAIVRNGVMHCDTHEAGPNGEPPIEVLGWPKEVA